FPAVSFLAAGDAVAGPAGESVRSVVGADGEEVVLRQLDQHLCPAGVERMARVVLADLVPRLGAEPAVGWEQGPWRQEPEHFQNPEQCPELVAAGGPASPTSTSDAAPG
ncbi:hypothetical protein B7486_70000, partial [cyanobacterium TDX16]